MRVFGTISKYTLDVMGQAVMAEQFEKDRLGLLPQGFWYRHIVPYETSVSFIHPYHINIHAFLYSFFILYMHSDVFFVNVLCFLCRKYSKPLILMRQKQQSILLSTM